MKRLLSVFRRGERRAARAAKRSAAVLGLAYAALLANPAPLFAYAMHKAPFSVHSDRPIPEEMRAVLAEARRTLADCPLAFPADEYRVFINNDAWRRRLVNPAAAGAFGAFYPAFGTVHVGACDPAADETTRPGGATRPLSAVLTHECVHHAARRRVGLLSYLLLPTWANEGYAEHVAGGATVPPQRAAEAIAAGRRDPSPGFRYAEYRLAVEEASRRPGFTPSRLLAEGGDFESLLAAAAERRTGGR